MIPMLTLTQRRRDILTGLVFIVFMLSAITFGVKAASGALRPSYDLTGLFSSAGQGLLPGSDVKIRGVNVGEVRKIELRDGRALITLRMNEHERIPLAATAIIRPKTLFGEKFVDIDPGPTETTGPYLEAGQAIEHTVGGFELQKVLDDAFPILAEIDAEELGTVLSSLADGGRGLGPQINRSLRNFTEVTDVNVANDAQTRQFLADFAALSDELAGAADDLVGGARNLNAVLPDLNARSARLTELLEQAARLSTDVADVLDANHGFLVKNIVKGGQTIQIAYDNRGQVVPLVRGLRMFFQTLAEAIRIPLEDGTKLAAVKFVAGGGPSCGRTPSCPEYTGSGSASTPAPTRRGMGGSGGGPGSGSGIGLPAGADAIAALLGAVLP